MSVCLIISRGSFRKPGPLTPALAAPSPFWPLPAPAQGLGAHGSTRPRLPSCSESTNGHEGGAELVRGCVHCTVPGKPPISVSDVMTSETLRSHEPTHPLR